MTTQEIAEKVWSERTKEIGIDDLISVAEQTKKEVLQATIGHIEKATDVLYTDAKARALDLGERDEVVVAWLCAVNVLTYHLHALRVWRDE